MSSDLFEAIPYRQSTRGEYDGRAVAAQDLAALAAGRAAVGGAEGRVAGPAVVADLRAADGVSRILEEGDVGALRRARHELDARLFPGTERSADAPWRRDARVNRVGHDRTRPEAGASRRREQRLGHDARLLLGSLALIVEDDVPFEEQVVVDRAVAELDRLAIDYEASSALVALFLGPPLWLGLELGLGGATERRCDQPDHEEPMEGAMSHGDPAQQGACLSVGLRSRSRVAAIEGESTDRCTAGAEERAEPSCSLHGTWTAAPRRRRAHVAPTRATSSASAATMSPTRSARSGTASRSAFTPTNRLPS